MGLPVAAKNAESLPPTEVADDPKIMAEGIGPVGDNGRDGEGDDCTLHQGASASDAGGGESWRCGDG